MNYSTGRRLYFPPTATELTSEQARNHLDKLSNCSDREVADFLQSIRQEQQKRSEKHAPNWDADEPWERSA
jgi:hypothetical protein